MLVPLNWKKYSKKEGAILLYFKNPSKYIVIIFMFYTIKVCLYFTQYRIKMHHIYSVYHCTSFDTVVIYFLCFFHRLQVPLKIGVDLTGYSLQCKLINTKEFM